MAAATLDTDNAYSMSVAVQPVNYVEAVMAPDDPRRFDVFLSYARDDEPRVAGVQQTLEARGLEVWRDRGQIRAGDSWVEKLEVGLRQSRCVVLFHLEKAAASEWVQREWNVALTVHMLIIPARLDDSELPLLLKTVQCVDYLTVGRLQSAVEEIVTGIRGSAVRAAQAVARAQWCCSDAPSVTWSAHREELESMHLWRNGSSGNAHGVRFRARLQNPRIHAGRDRYWRLSPFERKAK